MTNTVQLELTSCTDCPHWNSERYYTADSFEHVMEWKCKKVDNKTIALQDWNDKDPGIPDFCPLLEK